MGKDLRTALCFAAFAAVGTAVVTLIFGAVRAEEAFSPRGQWQITGANRSFSGVLLIDAQGRATWDAGWKPTESNPVDSFGRAKSRGYIKIYHPAMVEIILTNGIAVEHVPCAVQSNDLLHCRWTRQDGERSAATLTRVGPGPQNLMSALP